MPSDFVEYLPLHPRPGTVSGTADVTSLFVAVDGRLPLVLLHNFTTKRTNFRRLSVAVYLACTLFFSSLHLTSLSPPVAPLKNDARTSAGDFITRGVSDERG